MAAVAISFAVALLSCLSTATSALIRFNASEYNVSEGDGFVVVCLEVNSNETQSSINSVTVFTTSDSANSENRYDFIMVNETFNFTDYSPGDQCWQVNVSITDDGLFEERETFNITAIATFINSTDMSVSTSSRITIIDDEDVTILIRAPQYAKENDSYVSVCAELVDPSDGLETNVSLEITAEYKDNTMNVPLTFAAGSQVGAMECFNVSIMDNGIFEDDSMITLMSQSEQNRVEILNDTVVIMVLDDEILELTVDLVNDEMTRNITVKEGNLTSNPLRVCADLMVARNQIIRRNFIVNISTVQGSGSATENEDYQSNSLVIEFTPEMVVNSFVEICLDVNITDDSFGEPFECFFVVVESQNRRVIINDGLIKVTIQDNEFVSELIPMNFTAMQVYSRNITFSWNHPTMLNNVIEIIGYTINCNKSLNPTQVQLNSTALTATVTDLRPFTYYGCEIYALVNGNRGESAGTVTIMTAEDRPESAPVNIRVMNKTPKNIMFIWDPPTIKNGIIVNYTLRFNRSRSPTEMMNVTSSTNFTLDGLKPFELVSVKISGMTSVGLGPFSPRFEERSSETRPGEVDNLSVTTIPNSITSLGVTWSQPRKPNGIILGYNSFAYNVHRNCNDYTSEQASNSSNITNHILNDLASGKPYLIIVRAKNSAGEGENQTLCTFTLQTEPMGPKNVTAERNDDKSVTVRWTNLTLVDARGWIQHYIVYYWAESEDRSNGQNIPTDGIKTELKITNDIISDIYQSYYILVTVRNGFGESRNGAAFLLKGRERPIPGPIIGGAVALCLVILIIIISIVFILYLFRRRIFQGRSATLNMKRLSPPNNIPLNAYRSYNSDDSSSDEVSTDIPVFEFATFVQKMHRDSNHLFEQQYRSIKDAKYSHRVAFLPCNSDTKNRFIDIYPYDTNRVLLTKTALEGSDYINASWIDGYQRKRAYIAAQGPMEDTIEDFWRMIAEYDLSTIVMVTRLVEGPRMIEKCKAYWPQKVGQTMKFHQTGMYVTLKETKPFADYCINTLTLKRPHCADFEVTQFHYLGWPDHGVPQYATSLLGFLRHIRKKHSFTDTRPLLVHCSAGVGRTGTFITLDVMLQKIKEEQIVNVYEFVKHLRKNRCQMVQTESQYIFIHDALNEYITSGDTEIAVGNLRIALGKLYQNNSSGFRRQFKLLSETSRRPHPVDFDAANSELHQHKNRFPEKIPYKDRGVRLKPSGVLGGEYINASFINGYKRVDGFIATQAPLEQTVEAFWRLVWEYKCQTVVVLCDVEKEENCVRFWPGSGSETYGKLRVTLSSKPSEKNGVVKSKLEVNFDKQRSSSNVTEKLTVNLFQHTDWNENGEQPMSRSVLQLNTDIVRSQISTGNKPIIVTCNDGCGRTGTFLTIYSQIERLKTEQVVDVFQWVKSSRIQRAWLVTNQEQYELIYEVLADFLDTFDTYANFQVAEDEL